MKKRKIVLTESQLSFVRLLNENAEVESIFKQYDDISKAVDGLWLKLEHFQIGDIDQQKSEINRLREIADIYEDKLNKLSDMHEPLLVNIEASLGHDEMLNLDGRLDSKNSSVNNKTNALQLTILKLLDVVETYESAKSLFQNLKKLEINN